jgi:hypothetical protein
LPPNSQSMQKPIEGVYPMAQKPPNNMWKTVHAACFK